MPVSKPKQFLRMGATKNRLCFPSLSLLLTIHENYHNNDIYFCKNPPKMQNTLRSATSAQFSRQITHIFVKINLSDFLSPLPILPPPCPSVVCMTNTVSLSKKIYEHFQAHTDTYSNGNKPFLCACEFLLTGYQYLKVGIFIVPIVGAL